jgi:hypothetical protein
MEKNPTENMVVIIGKIGEKTIKIYSIYICIYVYIYIKWGTNTGNGHVNWDFQMVNHHRICRNETT